MLISIGWVQIADLSKLSMAPKHLGVVRAGIKYALHCLNLDEYRFC